MSITDYSIPVASVRYPLPMNTNESNRPLHQLAAVRRREGLSRRAIARRMGTDIASVKQQEEQTSDVRLSDLYRWQKALGVPMVELLIEAEEESLSPPVFKRAQMLRLMKTAAAILERSEHAPIRRMAKMLVEQIMEIMPELESVSPWNAVGQRRSLDDLGQAAQRRFSMDSMTEMVD